MNRCPLALFMLSLLAVPSLADEGLNSTGTPDALDMNLLACSGPCAQYKQAFLVSDSPLTIKAECHAASAVTGTATLPSRKETKLNFLAGAASLPLAGNGTYLVKARAEKPGYAPVERELEIRVYNRLSEAAYADLCNENGICEGNEAANRCPFDCTREQIASALEGTSEGNVTGALPDKTVEGVARPQVRGTEWLIIPIAALLILIVAMTIMNRRTIKGRR